MTAIKAMIAKRRGSARPCSHFWSVRSESFNFMGRLTLGKILRLAPVAQSLAQAFLRRPHSPTRAATVAHAFNSVVARVENSYQKRRYT